ALGSDDGQAGSHGFKYDKSQRLRHGWEYEGIAGGECLRKFFTVHETGKYGIRAFKFLLDFITCRTVADNRQADILPRIEERQKLMDFLLHGKPSYEHQQFVFRFAAAQPVAHLTVFEIGMTVDYIHAARNDVQAFYPFGVQFIPDCMRSDQ